MSRVRERFPRSSAFLSASQAALSQGRSPVLFSYGFRPFFVGASVWALISLVPWLGWAGGGTGSVAWHAHEALFGFGGAAVAGFLLTAIPNWTGRPPITGPRLAILFGLWCAGRLAFAASEAFGALPAAAIDSALLPLLVLPMTRDVIAGRNWRNLKTVALLALFAAANIDFHAEVLTGGDPDRAIRLSIAALIGLLMLIGGRMAPNFTNQWLLVRGAMRLPPPFGPLDRIALAVTGAALLCWVVRPQESATAFVLALAGALQTLRISRWRALSTWREPLLLILHVGHGFIPLGLLLVSLAVIAPQVLSPMAALHAWTTGAIGVMSLAVMTRAARGHSGRPPIASRLTTASYVAIVIAALLRIAAGIVQEAAGELVAMAAIAWILSFALFLIEHAAMLVREKTP